MPTLLFVDDDRALLCFNSTYFKKLGYDVLCAPNAQEALRILSTAALSCVILDIDMPGEDGFEVCLRLREQSALPVIFLSALTEAEMRIKSFLVGADDFLGKPYHIKELELRINARIQSATSHTDADALCFGHLLIDTKERTVSYRGVQSSFTTLQFDVLVFLAKHPRQAFSYEQIYDRVWKTPIMGSKHNLQVIIATVRQKLTTLCNGKSYIETIPRKGYRFIELDECEKKQQQKATLSAD